MLQPGTFTLTHSYVSDLTLELAQNFHALTPSPTERTLNQGRLKMLREKAEAQQLIAFHWAKARLDGQWFRVNGQHSSQMLVELNGTFPTGLKAHVDEYDVADLQGLALLFRQFDDKKSGRSSADVAGAYQNIEPALHDVPREIGKLAIDGVTFYRHTIAKEPTPKGDSAYTLFHEMALVDFIKWTAEVFSIKTPEMKPRPVVAAMYASFVAAPQEAQKFWDAVARGGEQYDESAPSTVLDEWLKKLAAKGEHVKVTPVQMYLGCIFAYNAYRKGQPLNTIKYNFKVWLEPTPKAA